MEHIEIRKVLQEDMYILHRISKQTFKETFSSVNKPENMIKYIDEELSIPKLGSE